MQEQNYAQSRSSTEKDERLAGETELEKDKGVYVGTEDDMDEDDEQPDNGYDGLDDIWKEMTVALECSKVGEICI